MNNYPGKYSNDAKANEETLKDKSILNQAAGSIEFINTKDQESLEITSKQGSHIKFNKFGRDDLTTRDKREHIMGDSLVAVNGRKTEMIDEDEEKIVLGDTLSTVGDADKWIEPMTEIKKEQRELHDMKRLFEVKRTNKHNDIDQAPDQTKSGTHAKCPSDSTSSKMIVTNSPPKKSSTTVGSREVIKIEDGDVSYKTVTGSGNRCLTCWGKLLSPSTQDGNWQSEEQKQQIVKKREEIQKKIYEYEKELGQNKHPNGGTSIQTIAKNFVQNIGLVFNDFESYRKDPNGKLVPCGVKIDPLGTTIYTQYKESALVEQVDVEKFPGGQYNMNVCDGWTATVGSNGIEFKTTGPLNLFGPMVNVVGETVGVGAHSEMTLEAPRVDITGDIITLRPKKGKRTTETGANTEDEQQVLVDGNLNVGSNAIIKGGAHVEGELSVQHISAPAEYQITETDFTYGKQQEPKVLPPPSPDICHYGENGKKVKIEPEKCSDSTPKSPTYATLLPGALIGKAVGTDSNGDVHCLDVYSVESENFAVVDEHVHYFKTIASKLFEENSNVNATAGEINASGSANAHDAVRAVGARNNWPSPVLAKPVKNSKNGNTVTEKFGGPCEDLTINKTDWEESSEDESLPDGEGVRTSKYTDEEMRKKIKSLEADLESKYAELKTALSQLSRNSC